MDDEKRLRRNAYMRDWKRKNAEKVNAINMAVKAKNPNLYKKINRESAARQRLNNPEHHTSMRHMYRANNPERYLVNHARQRAKLKGLPFGLEEADIHIPEFCPALGIRLQWGVGQRASANAAAPSLDRIVPEKGYVKGNVMVISNRANLLRNNATADELFAVTEYARLVESL